MRKLPNQITFRKYWLSFDMNLTFISVFILSLIVAVDDVTTAVDIYSFGMCALEVRQHMIEWLEPFP